MLEELEGRNYSAGTTRRYLRFVERFAQHFGKSPDQLGPDDLRSYQAYLLRELKLCPGSVENHASAGSASGRAGRVSRTALVAAGAEAEVSEKIAVRPPPAAVVVQPTPGASIERPGPAELPDRWPS